MRGDSCKISDQAPRPAVRMLRVAVESMRSEPELGLGWPGENRSCWTPAFLRQPVVSGAFSCDSMASMRNLSQQTEAYYIALVSDLAKRAASQSAEKCCARRLPWQTVFCNGQGEARFAVIGWETGGPWARQLGSPTQIGSKNAVLGGCRGVEFSMPPARLERARPVRAQALNLPCIPIPPRGQYEWNYNRIAAFVKRPRYG